MTSPFAEVIGDPIIQSKSPAIHNFWLSKLGIDANYRHCHVTAEQLPDYFAERRKDSQWRGCNITMPHKQAALAELDHYDEGILRIGAVNTVIPMRDEHNNPGLTGYNTDVTGFLEPLGSQQFDYVSVIGAGGAARAVLAALSERQVQSVVLQNRSMAKGKDLLEMFGLKGTVVQPGDEISPVQLLVNTSSLGMAGHPPIPPVERYVLDGGIVYDIVTAPLDTALLKSARVRGLSTIDGLAMLIGQAAAAFEKFFGAAAPRQFDAELRALLTA